MYSMEVVDERGIPRSRLPIEERYSARFFDLKDVFTDFDLESATVFEPSEYSDVGSWEQYRTYMSSPLSEKIQRPWKGILNYKEFNPIGVDSDDELEY